MKFIFISFIFSLYATISIAEEACSRVAIINNQEILVDSSSSQKGEGVRYYLEKDPISKKLLEEYQYNSQLKWPYAIAGTTGTGLILFGVLSNMESKDKKALLIGGASILLVNYLLVKTFESNNEKNLIRAINEYNKRNLPRIYFAPAQEASDSLKQSSSFKSGIKVAIGKTWTF